MKKKKGRGISELLSQSLRCINVVLKGDGALRRGAGAVPGLLSELGQRDNTKQGQGMCSPAPVWNFLVCFHAPLVLFTLPVSLPSPLVFSSLCYLSSFLPFLCSYSLFSPSHLSILSVFLPALCFPLPAPSWLSGVRTPGAAVPRCWLRLQPLPLFSVHTAVSKVG